MNKKKVALALAVALSLNTLMATVGNVNGQALIAHAQEGRLTNPEQAYTLKVNSLETIVENVEKGFNNKYTVTLSFKGLDKSNVSDITVTGATGKYSKDTGKLVVSDLNSTDLNRLNLTVKYSDSTVKDEAYEVTLRRTNVQNKLTADVNVGVGTIEVKNVKLSDKPVTLDSNNTLELQLPSGSVVDTINSTGDYEFTVVGMKAGQAYNIVYKENGTERGRAQIVLTEQAIPVVEVVATTNEGKDIDVSNNNIASTIATDYGVETSKVSVSDVTEVDKVLDRNIDFKIDGQTIVSYTQTLGVDNREGSKSNKVVGGVKTSAKVNGTNVDLTFSDFSVGKQNQESNFTTHDRLLWGPMAEDTITQRAAVAGQIIATANGQSAVVFDAQSKITEPKVASVDISGTKYKVLSVTPGDASTNKTNKTAESSAKITFDTSSLSHGYNSVAVDFTADSKVVANGKSISELQSLVSTDTTTSETTSTILPQLDTGVITGKTTTAVILSKDSLDATTVQANFEGKDPSKGQLTIEAKGLFKGISDKATLVKQLTVSGASSITYNSGDNNKVVFDVTFDKEVPSDIEWMLKDNKDSSNYVSGKIQTEKFEVLNVTTSIVDRPDSTNGIYLDLTFSGINIPAKSELELKDFSNKVIGSIAETTDSKTQRLVFDNIADLKTGDYVVEIRNGDDKYEVGLQIVQTSIGVEIIDLTSTTNTGVTAKIKTYLGNTDTEKNENVKKIKTSNIQYRELTVDKDGKITGYKDSEWKNASNVSFTEADYKSEVTKTISGLNAGSTYAVRVVYGYGDNSNTAQNVYSNIKTVKVASTSTGGTITGDGGSSTTGTSTGSTSISLTDRNSVYGNGTATVDLPTSIKVTENKTPVTVDAKYKDSNGKVVTETKEQYSGITARFENGKIVLEGLVPGKDYTEISVDYTDNNGRTKTLVLKNVKTTNGTELQKYLANVYSIVFNRQADETGYNFHLNNLKDKKVSLRSFLLNMLTEKEFGEYYKTPETKIESLYNAIVNRSSDIAGKEFWVTEYNKLLKVYGSEAATLQAISDRMVNENELKELSTKLGVEW